MSGKRAKEPIVTELRQALERFHDLLEDYRETPECERQAARAEAEPHEYLVRALDRQIVHLRQVESLLDERLWPDLVTLANGSTSIVHTRTREFF
jgi:hypothetical protein